MNICIADNFAKFFEIDFASSVFVGEEDCLIDDLLQLSVFQVRTNHHFQHLEELTVADVPIIVNIVDSETIKKIGLKYRFIQLKLNISSQNNQIHILQWVLYFLTLLK